MACELWYGIDSDMMCCLCYLAKVGRGIEGGGLLVPTIFRWAVGAGLGYVIMIIVLSEPLIFLINPPSLLPSLRLWRLIKLATADEE